MASPLTAAPSDPRNQTFFLQGPQNTSIPVWIPDIDATTYLVVSTSINYATQIGACFIMLLVALTMTSKTRFSRASTLINLASLFIGTIRCTLLALYFTSSNIEFYSLWTDDYSFVKPADTRISAVATFLAVPQIVLIEAALFLQAYSMIRMWPSVWRNVVLALSASIAACAVGFKCANVILRIRSYFDSNDSASMWIAETDLSFTATTIFWFCFVFIIRLVIHMWEFRSVLPPMNGLSAMEVLVMTNGILMLVPVIFAAIELGQFTPFEAGSLTYTSVVVLLPLGSLIAQNVSRTDCYILRSGKSGGSANTSGSRNTHDGDGANSIGGAYGRAAAYNTVACKASSPDFGTWSHTPERSTAATTKGSFSTKVNIQSGTSQSPENRARNNSLAVGCIEKQLLEADAAPNSQDRDRVRVEHEIEVRQDLV
ncbi:pheromone alpha factor receptor [Sporothrix epigloea]|uniref:Pheromone alpha factor receptor n=1 Tax=Sporothrix epigloea TaxID=1892477 RepID=A0ABP0DSS3_9PEZI